MKKVHKALMFICRGSKDKKEFFVLDRRSGDHVVLTGHQEKGETIRETAIRETMEELEVEPIDVRNINEVNTVVLENGTKESTEHAFLIEIPSKDVQYLKGKEKHSWHEIDKLIKVLSYDHQIRVARKVKDLNER